MNKIGYALVGAGAPNIATSCHLPALINLKDELNIRLMDISEGVKDYAGKYGLRYTMSFDEILNDKNIQIVDICTPDQFHSDMAIKALDAGKHVICQKPMALNIEDAKKMVETAKMKNLKLQIMTCMRYDQPYIQIKGIIDRGEIGIVKYIKYSYRGRYFPYPKGSFYRQKESGGQIVHNGMHYNDLLFWFMNKIPVSVSVHSISNHSQYKEDEIIDNDNYYYLSYGFDEGEIVDLEINLMCPKIEGRGVDLDILVIGTRGAIAYDQSSNRLEISDSENAFSKKYHFKGEDSWRSFYFLIKNFVDAVKNNKVQEVPAEFSLNVFNSLMCAVESINKQQIVKINRR